MITVAALGGNALIRRGEKMDVATQRANIKIACRNLAPLFASSDMVITHGNGPQIGLLALQDTAYDAVAPYPLDVLSAETEGMIGYLIAQELANTLGHSHSLATLLTQVQVDPDDPAFLKPVKPIGPQYTRSQAESLSETNGWEIAADGDSFRRVVPSPTPKRILEVDVIRTLLESGTTVICAGGGGIPSIVNIDGMLEGIEAVIDKDLASALLATQLGAEKLLLLTDVNAVYRYWGTADQQAIQTAHPDAIQEMNFADGSMGPKVEAAIQFARNTGGVAGIGSLSEAGEISGERAGTLISKRYSGINF